MKQKDFYSQAHLAVAAIRVLTHQTNGPPSVEAVCRALSFSLEEGHMICRRIEELDIIEVVEGAFGTRLFVREHLKLEEIPRDSGTDKMGAALKKFQNSQKERSKKIESFKAQQDQKRKDLFAELEKKLKDNIKNR